VSVTDLSESGTPPSACHSAVCAHSFYGALKIFVVGLMMILLLSKK
jgi:hypothetical protein